MTEQEWLEASDPRPMLAYLRSKASQRKLRLFICACCHRVLGESPWEELSEAVRVGELFVENVADSSDLADAQGAVSWGVSEMCESLNLRAEALALVFQQEPLSVDDVIAATERMLEGWRMNVPDLDMEMEKGRQRQWLRHLVGNPFRPYRIPVHWPSPVVQLADTLYNGEDCSFALIDALEEAGHPELTTHFRDEKDHPKGCWVLDLILGKE